VIACFGDSLTAGYGLAEDEAWPAVLGRARPAWTVLNAGVSGDTSGAALRRVGWMLKARPDVVVIALGANDGLRGLPLERLEANLADIISRVQAAGARPVLAGMRLPTNLGADYRDAFAAIYPRLAQRFAIPLLPFLLEGVAMVPDLNQADAIHPNAAGHRAIAALVETTLAPLVTGKAP
jgi:acyl-CoA thioesterase-1